MIIFGNKNKSKIISGFEGKCVKCKKKTIHYLVKVVDYFTLYFISLIPLSNKLYAICGLCGLRREIKDKEKIYSIVENKEKTCCS